MVTVHMLVISTYYFNHIPIDGNINQFVLLAASFSGSAPCIHAKPEQHLCVCYADPGQAETTSWVIGEPSP